MKRKISLILAIIMILSIGLCACNKEKSVIPPVATPRPVEETYTLAMFYISQGNYEMGYAALLSINTYEKAAEALKHFYHLPEQIAMRAKGETNPENYDYIKFSYGKNGLIMGRNFLESNTLVGSETFKYEDGLLKTSEFKGKGLKAYTSTYTFDGEGRLFEVLLKDEDENFAKLSYKYDESGKVREEEKTDYDGTVTVSEFVYGKNDKVSVKRSYREVDGERKLVLKCEYTYNDKDILTGGTMTEGDKVTELGYSSNRLYYNPDYTDLMMYY